MVGVDHQSAIQLHSDKDPRDRPANHATIHGLFSVQSAPLARWPEERLMLLCCHIRQAAQSGLASVGEAGRPCHRRGFPFPD